MEPRGSQEQKEEVEVKAQEASEVSPSKVLQ